MATFGRITTSSGNRHIENRIDGTAFTCPEAGTASKLTAYIYVYSAANLKAKGAIYKVSDDTLVAQTDEVTLSTFGSWYWQDFTFSSPPSLTNQDYYLVLWGNSWRILFAYGNGAWSGYKQYEDDAVAYGANFPNPWSPSELSSDVAYSIYCTYTPSVGGMEILCLRTQMEY